VVNNIHKVSIAVTTESYREGKEIKVREEKIVAEKTKKIVGNNKEAWVGTKKYVPKSILKEAVEPVKVEVEPETTVYNLELEFKQDDPATEAKVITDNKSKLIDAVNAEANIENVRAKNKEELETITTQLGERQEVLVNVENDLQELEEKRVKFEEEFRSLKLINVETQKQTEGLEKMLNVVNDTDSSERDLERQCRQIEAEIEQMQNEWQEHKKNVADKITVYKTKIEKK